MQKAMAVDKSPEGYARATVPKGGEKELDEVVIRPSKNGGFIFTEQYRRTRDGKARMSTPDWMPPERPMTFDNFEDMTVALRKCFGVKSNT